MKQNLKQSRLVVFVLIALMVTAPLLAGANWFGSGRTTVTIPREEYERLKQYALLDEVKQYVDAYFYEEPTPRT